MIPARTDALEADPATATDAVDADAPVKRRPARRQAKPDAVLAAAVDFAREGILQMAPAEQVGGHVTSYPEGERLTTHRFEAFVPGYGNWHWFITLARVARSKEPTICEVGLLPSETALLAPQWLPWSERVRPEDHQDAVDPAAPGEPATELTAQEPASVDPVPGTDAGTSEPGTDRAPDDTDRATDEPVTPNAAVEPAAEDATDEPELDNATDEPTTDGGSDKPAADSRTDEPVTDGGGPEPDAAGPSEADALPSGPAAEPAAGPIFAEPFTPGRDD
ncbi:DUF3027 domain-containing protein [Arthrobacter crusticola]|uniref:DUF3027 domain-containing protein n=1 Tax=Arthrobacter crusticola TaxID=2547960 RepID=A0A4R5TYY5_9MICC|nr:DUF3027 domain-containing protein [Arthrobacter crusticola]TDK26430.1 DUF3027 domain-containing protein [Arthrobacter crusticola]